MTVYISRYLDLQTSARNTPYLSFIYSRWILLHKHWHTDPMYHTALKAFNNDYNYKSGSHAAFPFSTINPKMKRRNEAAKKKWVYS